MSDVRTRQELENISRATAGLVRLVDVRPEAAPGAAPQPADVLLLVGPVISATGAAAVVQLDERPRVRAAWAVTLETK